MFKSTFPIICGARRSGAYIVQSRTPLDEGFRGCVQAAGASIVSYIPNNAYLVRASASAANAWPQIPHQAVLPYEPYYKLQPSLLAWPLRKSPCRLASGSRCCFSRDGRCRSRSASGLGVQVLAEERSPFGPVLKVRSGWLLQAKPRLGFRRRSVRSRAAPGVQRIELARPRVLANDLSRARIAVAADTVTPEQLSRPDGQQCARQRQ